MKRPRSLAAAQTVPEPGDLAGNLEGHVELARVASDEGAEVVVFPELSLTGYELDLAPELALTEMDSRLRPLTEAARNLETTLIVGAPVRIGSRLHIGAFVLSPDLPVQVYTKRHLGAFGSGANPDGPVPPGEETVFDPGDADPVVPVGDDTAGAVAICADARRPSHAARAARGGARTYFASMFVIPSDFREDTAKLERYAARHSMAVVFSNFGGPTGGLPSAGGSAIWSETGDLLTQLEEGGRGVAVAVEEPDGWRAASIMLEG